jgi:recombinational DNA repair protein (RecF pathway)
MAYQTYITEALVCGVFDSNTSDRSFLLFTKEAGMIYAHAKSVREEKSKQRYALQVASYVRVTLVRGKSGWKIAGVEAIKNFYACTRTREERALVRNIILLLRRVIQGEVAQNTIFTDVANAFEQGSAVSPYILERIVTLRVLHHLGYIAPAPLYDIFLESSLGDALKIEMPEETLSVCETVIAHAFMQSQL